MSKTRQKCGKCYDVVSDIVKQAAITDELKRFLVRWEAAVCEIRAENKACENNVIIAHLVI